MARGDGPGFGFLLISSPPELTSPVFGYNLSLIAFFSDGLQIHPQPDMGTPVRRHAVFGVVLNDRCALVFGWVITVVPSSPFFSSQSP